MHVNLSVVKILLQSKDHVHSIHDQLMFLSMFVLIWNGHLRFWNRPKLWVIFNESMVAKDFCQEHGQVHFESQSNDTVWGQ